MSDLLSLQRYAFVTVALSEGYTLSEVLERERLSEEEWEGAEEHWVEKLQDSAEEDLSLHDDLDRALAAERARFARKVAPLDTDVAAFLTFQRHALSAPNLSLFLREQGLFLGDWVRLLEGWAERFITDGELRAAAATVLAEEAPRPLTAVNPDPRVWPAYEGDAQAGTDAEEDGAEAPISWGLAGLRDGRTEAGSRNSTPIAGADEAPRSSFGTAAPVPPEAVAAGVPLSVEVTRAPVLEMVERGANLPFRRPMDTSGSGVAPEARESPAMTLAQYASLCAELAASPYEVESIFHRHGLKDVRQRLTVDLWWRERLRRDPAEHQQWQALYQRFHAYWVEQTRRHWTH